MAYCRVETADGYTVMSNYHLRDMRLSLKARGLLSQILSLPEKWDMTISGLSKINRECSDTIASIIKELEATGYITRYRERRDNGTYGEIFYDIRMKPRHFDDPKQKKSERVKPKQMSSAQLSKEKSNKEKENKELLNIHQSILPDGIDKIDGYRAIILENIEYDLIVNQYNKAQLDEIVDIMLECVCSEAETQNIGRDKVPTELVKSRILKLNSMHIEYIFSCLKENPSKVRNIKSYLKTVLYNAAVTIDNYYTSEVNYHFNRDGIWYNLVIEAVRLLAKLESVNRGGFLTRKKAFKIVLLILLLWITLFTVDWLTVVFFDHSPIFCIENTDESQYTGLGYSYVVYPHPINGEFEYCLSIFGLEVNSTFTN